MLGRSERKVAQMDKRFAISILGWIVLVAVVLIFHEELYALKESIWGLLKTQINEIY